MMKPKIFKVTKTPKGLDNILSVNPNLASKYYCAVVNVSDTPCATFDYQAAGVPSFWFPINEMADWTHAPFYGTLKVVNEYYKGDKPVLIHCHAGANRSPSVAFAILLSKGYTWQEAEEALEYPRLYWVFQRNIKRKHIPETIVDFLVRCNQDPTYSIMGVLRKQSDQQAKEITKKIAEQNSYNLAELGLTGFLRYKRDVKKFVHEMDEKQ